jgi:hypothetical protein
MYSYNEQIRAFEADCINLSQAMRDQLRQHREANRNRLKKNRPAKIRLNDDHFIPQGSMAIQTTVQEKDRSYDIDDGVWFHADDLMNDDGTRMTARQVQQMVCDALQDAKFDKKPKILGNCVRVFYAEGYNVDIPCYRVFDAGTANERKELAGENGWVLSDPTEINRWFEGEVQSRNKLRDGAGGQMRVQTRLMKRFARSRGDKWDMPNGLKLTMLVEECCSAQFERDDECLYWLLRCMKQRLDANLEVENRAQSKYPKDKLTKSPNDANMIELRDHVGEALDKLAILHDTNCTKQQAREAWDWVFRTDGYFEAYDKDADKARALFAKAAAVQSGTAATSAFVTITNSGVANRPHSFYGDVH